MDQKVMHIEKGSVWKSQSGVRIVVRGVYKGEKPHPIKLNGKLAVHMVKYEALNQVFEMEKPLFLQQFYLQPPVQVRETPKVLQVPKDDHLKFPYESETARNKRLLRESKQKQFEDAWKKRPVHYV